ncbi:GDSL esterase/lipase [Quillaja saponaria]|uniref:GDSL esterase/lipase n=1 Tax=Quillaja saponaria TaxID=32244 RepID=A0AAD7PWX8_QUISA|nr:GDSL esterase/lipase [Quillaja saponaria]
MEKQTVSSLFSLLFAFLLPFAFTGVQGIKELYGVYNGTAKLFVFGDSYADTGNSPVSWAGSWKQPYGVTFPGKPAGRFSDGRVLTDYIALFLRIRSPIPYKWRKYVNKSKLRYGMNFAYGGTGVFNTLIDQPNMTLQIDFFKKLIQQKVYTKQDLDSSIAFLSVAGNDYYTSNGKIRNQTEMPDFTKSVVNQISINLKRIYDLGVKKIAVTGLQALGCLPGQTLASSFQQCSETPNLVSKFHNQLLVQEVQKLNLEKKTLAFFILDIYSAFTSAINNLKNHTGQSKSVNPLQPCCVGTSVEFSCGSVNEKGEKKYSVCKNPEESIFWDMGHPSQNGWHSVYLNLHSSLHQFY